MGVRYRAPMLRSSEEGASQQKTLGGATHERQAPIPSVAILRGIYRTVEALGFVKLLAEDLEGHRGVTVTVRRGW